MQFKIEQNVFKDGNIRIITLFDGEITNLKPIVEKIGNIFGENEPLTPPGSIVVTWPLPDVTTNEIVTYDENINSIEIKAEIEDHSISFDGTYLPIDIINVYTYGRSVSIDFANLNAPNLVYMSTTDSTDIKNLNWSGNLLYGYLIEKTRHMDNCNITANGSSESNCILFTLYGTMTNSTLSIIGQGQCINSLTMPGTIGPGNSFTPPLDF
jgi:hypothetical protein